MKLNTQEKAGVTGELTAIWRKQDNPVLRQWNKTLESLNRSGLISRKRMYELGFWGKEVKREKVKNVICKAGFNAVCRRLADDTTYTGIINKALLGTGTTTATANDTKLETETYRNDIASGTAGDNIAYLTAFFSESEVTGTFTEFGNCIDGTGSADTGRLWSHKTGINWVKDGVTSLTVDCKYTFASV
ncbi:MAG: hypothetical protein BWY21_01899 [Parcubacteria group bacterium ADurb.Bin216]|nr:MAG: hypothetical protein BWY21_01899 [Parcubacteria group bacterium ADurb.Bin216]